MKQHHDPLLSNRRKFLTAAMGLAGTAVLAGCGQASTTEPATVVLLANGEDAFSEAIRKGAEAEALMHAIKFEVQTLTQSSVSAQQTLIEALLVRQIDAILISPLDSLALIDPLHRAYRAGTRILTIDSWLGDGDYSHGVVRFPIIHVSSNHQEAGRLAGERLLAALGGSGTVAIADAFGTGSAQKRVLGFLEAVAATNVVTVENMSLDEGDSTQAEAQTIALLERQPDIDAIFCSNLTSSLGVVHAIEKRVLSGHLPTLASFFDATRDGMNALNQGYASVLVAQSPREMGKEAVLAAVQAIAGEVVEKEVTTSVMVIVPETMNLPEAQASIYDA